MQLIRWAERLNTLTDTSWFSESVTHPMKSPIAKTKKVFENFLLKNNGWSEKFTENWNWSIDFIISFPIFETVSMSDFVCYYLFSMEFRIMLNYEKTLMLTCASHDIAWLHRGDWYVNSYVFIGVKTYFLILLYKIRIIICITRSCSLMFSNSLNKNFRYFLQQIKLFSKLMATG